MYVLAFVGTRESYRKSITCLAVWQCVLASGVLDCPARAPGFGEAIGQEAGRVVTDPDLEA